MGHKKTYLHMHMEARTCGMPNSCFTNLGQLCLCVREMPQICDDYQNSNYSLPPSKDTGYKNLKGRTLGNLPTASLTLEHSYQQGIIEKLFILQQVLFRQRKCIIPLPCPAQQEYMIPL